MDGNRTTMVKDSRMIQGPWCDVKNVCMVRVRSVGGDMVALLTPNLLY